MFKSVFQDKEYIRKLFVIALPLVIQQVLTYSVNLLDTLMVGSFGDAPLAAVNLSNQFILLFNMVVFGTISGGNVLNAQFWGKRDKENIHRVMGMQFVFLLLVGLFFGVTARLIPERLLKLYSDDAEVIANGAVYLRSLCPVFLLFPLTQIFSGGMRCTENTRVPMVISAIALSANALFNWMLIFGKLGCPALGLRGAAYATVIARFIEALLCVLLTYLKKLPSAASPRTMLSFRGDLLKLMASKSLPVIINEGLFGLGTNMYSAIYAGISTASIAAYSAISPIDNMAQSLFYGMGDACAVIIGNLLGANEFAKAKQYAKNTLKIVFGLSIFFSLALYLLRGALLSTYNLSAEAHSLAMRLMTLLAAVFIIKTQTYTLLIGILRPGGQALYGMIVEGGVMWLIGIPLAKLLATVFNQPMQVVYFGYITDEIVKCLLFMLRVRSGKWVKNLVE